MNLIIFSIGTILTIGFALVFSANPIIALLTYTFFIILSERIIWDD